MARKPVTPESPLLAAMACYTGTLFGFEWVDGVPHEAKPDTMCDAFASGEIHHYIDVEVSLARVVESLA
jgi:hypothetical protein